MKDFKNSPLPIEGTVEKLKQEHDKNHMVRNQNKAKLYHTILSDWKQTSSVFFWQQCFKFVPFRIIRQVYDNINMLQTDGYEIKSQAGFFVHTIKQMGYFPWQECNVE